MDTQTLTWISLWLWPLVTSGAESFVSKVGEKMGSTFADLAFKVIDKVRSESGGEEFGNIAGQPEKYQEQVHELVLKVKAENPDEIQRLWQEVLPSLKQLLRSRYFTPQDIVDELMADLNIRPEDIGMDTDHVYNHQARLANKLVENLFRDDRLGELIQEIRRLKPHLLTS